MNDSPENPYAPPNSTVSIEAVEKTANRLGPLWGWLVIAVIASYVCTPADPVSMLIALAYALASFSVGCVLGSSLDLKLRALLLILWLVPGAFFGVLVSGVLFTGDMACLGLFSVGMGYWACRSIQNGRVRILAAFCAGYIIGSFVGAIGTAVGAVTATMIASRLLRTRDISD